MDVKKLVLLAGFSIFLINCDQRSTPSNDNFQKAGNIGCDENAVRGEYLVHWKDGRVTVEKYKDDVTFIKDFVEVHEDEIIVSEPHYKITIEQKVETQSNGWGGYPNWGIDRSGADQLWGSEVASAKIKVAVIDSGVDIGHPELAAAIAVNEEEEINGIDDDGNGLIDDRYGYDFVRDTGDVIDYTGHGTHVAGSIAAQHDVGQVLGVAPNAKIIPIAFISGSGGGSVSAAVNSIRYAVNQKAKVVNASWGGDTCSTVLRSEIEKLAKHNILFVTAAGNRGNNLFSFPEYPAAFEIDNMITVGASAYDEVCTDSCKGREVMAIFSNYGELVDLMAPGADITSTYPPEFDRPNKDTGAVDGVETINGTSMASPHVAGAAALLWAIKPNASYAEIKKALLDGARPGPFRVKTRGSLYLPTALSLLEQ